MVSSKTLYHEAVRSIRFYGKETETQEALNEITQQFERLEWLVRSAHKVGLKHREFDPVFAQVNLLYACEVPSCDWSYRYCLTFQKMAALDEKEMLSEILGSVSRVHHEDILYVERVVGKSGKV